MNILIGKIGKSSSFNDKQSAYLNYGGYDIMAKMFITFAECFPQNTFYLGTASDFTKIKSTSNSFLGKPLPNNIVDLMPAINLRMREYKASTKAHPEGKAYQAMKDEIDAEDLKIDKALFVYQFSDYGNTLPDNLVKNLKSDTYSQPLQIARTYFAPIVWWIDNTTVPYAFMIDDPRELHWKERDIIRKPECVFSQVNTTIPYKRITGFKEASKIIVNDSVQAVYSGIEKAFLIGKTRVDFTTDTFTVDGHSYKKDIPFTLVLNGTRDRLNNVEKWIFPFVSKDFKIYGNWTAYDIKGTIESKGYSHYFENKSMSSMIDIMWRTKYTYIPYVVKDFPEFVTQKVYSMIYYGIIPFWNKNEYDTTGIYSNVPEYCKVDSPEEMWQRINELEHDADFATEIRKKLYYLLTDDLFNGEYLIHQFSPYLNYEFSLI
jgi:hypothetical protein